MERNPAGLPGSRNGKVGSAIRLRNAAQVATIGIFVLLFVASLSFAQTIALPIASALVIGTVLAQITNSAADYGISRWLSAAVISVAVMAILWAIAVLIADVVIELTKRGPELGARLQQVSQAFARPLEALGELRTAIFPKEDAGSIRVELSSSILRPLLATITPALGELMLFFGTLIFFLIGRPQLRQDLAILPSERANRLRVLRTIGEIEYSLARYLTVVTFVNMAIGTITALGALALGLPNFYAWGVLAFVLNYVPFLGPGAMALVLFLAGLATFETVGGALLAPAFYMILVGIEGNLITPRVLGRQLSINPLAIFVSVAFWAWLWGPFGALLATPLLIVGLVAARRFFFQSETVLPN